MDVKEPLLGHSVDPYRSISHYTAPGFTQTVIDQLDARTRYLNIQLILLSLLVIFCMIWTNDACFDNNTLTYLDDCKIELPMCYVEWFLSILCIWRLVKLYQLLSKMKEFRWTFPTKWEAFWRTTLKYKFFCELVMYLLLPIPYRSNDKLHSGFTLLAFGRVYLIIRLFRDFSPLWRRRLFFSAQMRTDKNLRRIPPQYHSYLSHS